MPVMVSSADVPLAGMLVDRLLRQGGEVRAQCRPGEQAVGLRRSGAHVAVGQPNDVGLLEAAMAHVHTVVHPAGGLLSPTAEAIETRTAAVVAAAANAGVRRVIALSLPGARLEASDELRRAKARDERRLRQAPVPTVVVRVSLVDTAQLRGALAGVDLGRRVLESPVAPVRPDDLVELLVALDAARSRASEGHVVFAADGPAEMTLGAYLERAGIGLPGQQGRRVGHRYRPQAAAPLLAQGLGGPWVNRDERLIDGWAFADLQPQPPDAADSSQSSSSDRSG